MMTASVDPIPKEVRYFQGRRAGLITRALAAAIDIGVVAVAMAAAYIGYSAVLFLFRPARFQLPTPSWQVTVIVGYIFLTLYLTGSWHSGGRTYGCHVMGLRVVDRLGQRLGWTLAFLRAVLCAIFPIGLVWAAISRENRSIQDLIVRTSVIYDWDVRPRARG
jgi:uncharacterized RDD family membrane protein YckC